MIDSIKISAIVCTYNRPQYLLKSIESLVFQSLDSKYYEIIIVDNQPCNKSTFNICRKFMNKGRNLKYVAEPVTGLSRARNTGCLNSAGEIVAFLDDDAIAAQTWLEKILDIFNKSDEKLGSIGGKIDPIWESSRPDWLHEDIQYYLTILDLSDKPIYSKKGHIMAGANMAFRKNILMSLGGFDTDFGWVGNRSNFTVGDETFVCYLMWKNGYYSLYHPDVQVEHHVENSKLNKKWMMRRMFIEGFSFIRLKLTFDNQLNKHSIRNIFRLCKPAVKRLIKISLFRTHYNEKKISKDTAFLSHELGQIAAYASKIMRKL